MTVVRPLLLVVLFAGALTACDDSSRQGGQARRPYTNQQVLDAFAAAGIHLAPGTMARGVVPGLRAIFDGNGGVEVSGAVATVEVTSARIDRNVFAALNRPVPKAGRVGVMRPRHGVITDRLTRVTFCAIDVDSCGL